LRFLTIPPNNISTSSIQPNRTILHYYFHPRSTVQELVQSLDTESRWKPFLCRGWTTHPFSEHQYWTSDLPQRLNVAYSLSLLNYREGCRSGAVVLPSSSLWDVLFDDQAHTNLHQLQSFYHFHFHRFSRLVKQKLPVSPLYSLRFNYQHESILSKKYHHFCSSGDYQHRAFDSSLFTTWGHLFY
jgi:hypothetical protein